ncbi:MAG: CapA family protein [Solobacterium sp.]|nr:CapA family protein [Solobacterium sp.]
MAETVSLVFTGDIGFDKYMDGKWNDEELISDEILDFLHSGDHVVANVEGALVRQEKKEGLQGVQQLVHAMDPDAVRVLRKMGADIWNLCNNHILDAGDEGVRKTLEEAERFGAKTVGVGMNLNQAKEILYLPDAGGIGLFSVGFRTGCKPAGEAKAGCLLWNEMELIEENIREIKSRCRWCCLIVHGGEEFTSLPSPYVRERYLKFLDMGADMIVAHHPHVPMNYETVGDKVIFYSLGNFIFDTDYQRAQYHTEEGILLKLNFTEENYTWDAVGVNIIRGPEHIVKADLPQIFADVQQEEYEKLSPLAAKMFLAATKRQQIYLNRAAFENKTPEEWEAHFTDPNRRYRVPGEALDFTIIWELAQKEQEGAWKESRLHQVVEYILGQM